MPLNLITGGARSGKSVLAVDLARSWSHEVAFIATAEALDDEMTSRIQRHRRERPAHWSLIEEPLALEAAVAASPADAGLVIDCLTLWTANAMAAGLEDEEIVRRGELAARAAAGRRPPTVAVTNEVGSGVVPDNEMARRYRDLLGRVNVSWAEAAEAAFLVVAGRLLPLLRPRDVLCAGS